MMKLTLFIQEKFGTVRMFRNIVMIGFVVVLMLLAGCTQTNSPQQSYNEYTKRQAEDYRSWSGVKTLEQKKDLTRWEKRARCKYNFTLECWLMGY